MIIIVHTYIVIVFERIPIISVRPMKGILISETGKVFFVESGIRHFGVSIFCPRILNPALGVPVDVWTPDSQVVPLTGIRNLQRGIQNPRLYWITLHGVILVYLNGICDRKYD